MRREHISDTRAACVYTHYTATIHDLQRQTSSQSVREACHLLTFLHFTIEMEYEYTST